MLKVCGAALFAPPPTPAGEAGPDALANLRGPFKVAGRESSGSEPVEELAG